ncbi:MAG: 2-C-methyl-D-erythritol 4-phosphate cytidylyltransferase [Candidatus Omnitrophota bacterium]
MKVVAIVPAAGKGVRLGNDIAKPFVSIKGRPLLAHTLGVLNKSPLVSAIVVVAHRDFVGSVESDIIRRYRISKARLCIEGGKTRHESVYNALLAIRESDYTLVMIHDCARPFLTEDIIRRSCNAALRFGAACVGMPLKDTIKEIKNNVVKRTLDRRYLWQIQTPQVFRKKLVLDAYARFYRKGYFSDDASVVEKLKAKIRMVEGSYYNIKITTPEDIVLAEKIYEVLKGSVSK